MNFREFPKRFIRPKLRPGSAEDRGKLIPWPKAEARARSLGRSAASWPVSLRRIAPGIVTGAADVDPALVLTATVAGATFGYQLLWVVTLCVPFLLEVFSVSARIGHETRRGLVDLLLKHYGKPLALAGAGFIVVINMAMLVADLMAVTDALSIILDQRRIFFVAAVAFAVWYILIFQNYLKITHALVILSLPLYIYVAGALLVHPTWREVLVHTFVPRMRGNFDYATAVVALFGSLLTPYVLVWQTSSRSEDAKTIREIDAKEHRAGAFITSLLCFSIIVVSGTVLRNIGADVSSSLTTRDAAESLTPAVGNIGPILFALGIIGAGMVALPVLVASLCYSVSEAMEWKYGLSENPWEAERFYVLISAAVVLAALLNFMHVNPVTALYWSQILAGLLTVPILIFILLLSNDRRVMKTVNSAWQNFWIGAAAGALTAAGLLVGWWKLRGA